MYISTLPFSLSELPQTRLFDDRPNVRTSEDIVGLLNQAERDVLRYISIDSIESVQVPQHNYILYTEERGNVV